MEKLPLTLVRPREWKGSVKSERCCLFNFLIINSCFPSLPSFSVSQQGSFIFLKFEILTKKDILWLNCSQSNYTMYVNLLVTPYPCELQPFLGEVGWWQVHGFGYCAE